MLTFVGFLEFPRSLNVSVGQQAVFLCRHATAETLSWRINDTAISVFSNNLTNITRRGITFLPHDRSAEDVLTIDALSEYNNTSVVCVALFIGSPPEISSLSVLLIQGLQVIARVPFIY